MPELKTVLPNACLRRGFGRQADFVIEGYVDPREPLMGWPLNALMVRLLVIIGPDLFSAMEESKWKRAQRVAPKEDTT